MAQDRGPAGGRAGRAPFPGRSRKRWIVAGGVAGAWLVLYLAAGSGLSATVLLAAFAALGVIAVLFLRSIGVTRDHPRIRQLASRPWRDGQAVLRVAVSHLHEVFVVTPSGSVFAPASVEIQMNPEDLASLCDRMEFAVAIAGVTEVYEEQVARYGARLAGSQRAWVSVVADELVPRGRYRLRQGHPVTAAARREMPDAGDGWTWREPGPARTVVDARTVDARTIDARTIDARGGVGDGPVTVLEEAIPRVPVLRLVTGDSVAQTQMTGARAGRGSVELALPNVPTISREHARFEFADGRWRVTNLASTAWR